MSYDVRCLTKYGAGCHSRRNVNDSAAAKRSSTKSFRGHEVRFLSSHHRRDGFREEESSLSVNVEDSTDFLIESHVKGYNGLYINPYTYC